MGSFRFKAEIPRPPEARRAPVDRVRLLVRRRACWLAIKWREPLQELAQTEGDFGDQRLEGRQWFLAIVDYCDS